MFLEEDIKDDFELIVVDDSPGRETLDACSEFSGKLALRFIHRARRLGLASAVVRGFAEARGEYVVCMDGDGSHSPKSICQLVESLKQNTGAIVVASRYVGDGSIDEHWSWYRKWISRVSCLITRPLTDVHDAMSGFFALEKSLFDEVKGALQPRGYKIALELLVKSGARSIEVPFAFGLRIKGCSKVSIKVMIAYLYQLLHLYSYKFLHKKSRLK